MERLTGRQKEILDFIRHHIRENGYPPTIGEMMTRFSFSSPTAVTGHLEALERKGCIRRTGRISRGIALKEEPADIIRIPVLGRVPAGVPVSAEEDRQDCLVLERKMVGSGEFLSLQVRGESMRDAGLLDGDYAIVRKEAAIQNGDIVVASTGGEFTVKFFQRKRDGIELKPANPAFRTLKVTGDVSIVGRVIGIFRRMR